MHDGAKQLCPCQGLHSLQTSTCGSISFIKFTTQPLWAFDLGTPAFDFKALRPEEGTLLLLTSIVVSYSSS